MTKRPRNSPALPPLVASSPVPGTATRVRIGSDECFRLNPHPDPNGAAQAVGRGKCRHSSRSRGPFGP